MNRLRNGDFWRGWLLVSPVELSLRNTLSGADTDGNVLWNNFFDSKGSLPFGFYNPSAV